MQSSSIFKFKQIVNSAKKSRLLLLAPLLSACVTSGQTDLHSMALNDNLKIQMDRHHVCAVAIAVVKDRKLDLADSLGGCPSSPDLNSDSIFQAASLSKPVFAYAVLKLVEQGKIELDAPVVKYLPQGYQHRLNPLKQEPSELVTDPHIRSVTVRMALNHTSGLPNWASGRLNFDSTPGTKWSYSGEGYVLLQRAVETVSGEPLDRFMARQVFTPLGMTSSSFVSDERTLQNQLTGTKANGVPRKKIQFHHPVAAFTLTTTASDYGKFLVAVLGDAKLLEQTTASPATVDPSLGISWGLGWGVERTQDDLYIWHWGNNPGYRAFVIASPRTGNGFVMLTNSDNGLELAEPITNTLLPAEHKLFRFQMLRGDFLTTLCNVLHLCL